MSEGLLEIEALGMHLSACERLRQDDVAQVTTRLEAANKECDIKRARLVSFRFMLEGFKLVYLFCFRCEDLSASISREEAAIVTETTEGDAAVKRAVATVDALDFRALHEVSCSVFFCHRAYSYGALFAV